MVPPVAKIWSRYSTREQRFIMLCLMTRSVPKTLLAAGLEERIVLTLFDLSNHLQKGGERMAKQIGITTQQWLVLLQIAGDPNFAARPRAKEEPMLASEIARERGLGKPTISAAVAALKRKAYIREERDPTDGRRRRLVVTSRGTRAIERAEPVRRAANRRLLAELDRDDRSRFLEYLDRCMAVLWAVHEDGRLAVAQARLRGR